MKSSKKMKSAFLYVNCTAKLRLVYNNFTSHLLLKGKQFSLMEIAKKLSQIELLRNYVESQLLATQ